MPVTAKLSKLFYDRFGEAVANELVELLNQVDANSRADLKELNELNFARFDAKLEQRVAETQAHIDKVAAELNARIDKVAAELNARIDKVAAELNSKLEVGLANLDVRMARLETTVHKELRAQSNFLYLAWAVQLAAIVGLYVR